MDKKFTKTLRKILRNQLVKKNKIHIKGVGTWQLKHQTQYQENRHDGRVIMQPPRDVIDFAPDKKKL